MNRKPPEENSTIKMQFSTRLLGFFCEDLVAGAAQRKPSPLWLSARSAQTPDWQHNSAGGHEPLRGLAGGLPYYADGTIISGH